MGQAQEWTGGDATALRISLRLTVARFADRLGVAPRTVANWAANPDVIPRSGIQEALDGLAGDAPAGTTGPAQAFRVAISVVMHDGQVLLVRRRDGGAGLSWQFPAGVIKPGQQAEDVAVRETHAETGVHCSVREHIGRRLHPTTGVYCEYFLCDYLAGVADNRDTAENDAVAWAPQPDLTKFVPRDKVFPPILDLMEEQHAAGF